jgi:ParB-like chromosome segregation protein Spo0J
MSDVSALLEKAKKEINPINLSKLLYQLTKVEGEKLIVVAKYLNKKPAYLSHLIRLKKLPELIVDGYLSKMVSISHLYVISRLEKEEEMLNIYERVLTEDLNVFQTEELVRETKYQIFSKGKYFSKREIDRLNSLSANKKIQFGLTQNRIKSKLTITIKKNLAESEKILKLILERLRSLTEAL